MVVHVDADGLGIHLCTRASSAAHAGNQPGDISAALPAAAAKRNYAERISDWFSTLDVHLPSHCDA